MNREYLKLCLIIDASSKTIDQYEKFLLAAASGGITSVQIREKNLSLSELKLFAVSIKSILKSLNIPLIINDYIEIAKDIDADGIHLGQDDESPREARRILGDNKIIGFSIESLSNLEIANQLNCINYLAASAIFPSVSKNNCKTLWGLTGLKQITHNTRYPVIAIGGIDETNVETVMQHGASGIAVINAIHSHEHPKKISATLINLINKQLQERSKYV